MSAITAPRILIIGAGFAGLGMAYYLKRAGIASFTVLEKAADLGGVWRDNTYPGAACDVPSHLYSYSFDPHYAWSRAFGPQAEIHDYQQRLVDRHGLRAHLRFGVEVVAARYDEARALWCAELADGAVEEAEVLVSAVGQLHRPAIPAIPGRERFQGPQFHSARWDHGVDLAGKVVASLGTGPSAIQYVPAIAPTLKQLHVFQRSPAWCVPKGDRAYTRFERWLLTHAPWTHTLDRLRIYWYVEFVASVVQKRSWLRPVSRAAVRFLHGHMLRRQVADPALRAKLTPDFAVGCKRLLFANDWFETLARPNVELVTDAVAAIDATGVIDATGRHRAVDAIIHGTGFAATDFLAPMAIHGRGGRDLHQQWRRGAQAYLGLAVHGFPNFFTLYGPNTNLGVGTILYMLERQQRYVLACVERLRAGAVRSLEVREEAEASFKDEVDRRSRDLVYLDGCNSWYLSHGRNTQNWIGYMSEYGWRTRRPDWSHFVEVAR